MHESLAHEMKMESAKPFAVIALESALLSTALESALSSTAFESALPSTALESALLSVALGQHCTRSL